MKASSLPRIFLLNLIVVSSKTAWRTAFAICSALLRSPSLIALLNSLSFAVIRLLIWSGLKSSGNGSTYRNIHVQYVTTYRYWLLKVTTCHLICMQCDARVNIIKDILYLHRQMNSLEQTRHFYQSLWHWTSQYNSKTAFQMAAMS